jgi:hypothetical protein
MAAEGLRVYTPGTEETKMEMLDQTAMPQFNSLGRLSKTCLAIAGGLFLVPGALRADFIVTKVSSPGDPAFTQLLGINNSGTIAGYFGDGTIVPNNGFTLTLPNTFTPENFPGSTQTQVIGINSAGATVGFYVDAAGVTHGFQDVGGTFSTIDAPGTAFNQLLGLNDNGQSAGYSSLDPTGMTLQRAFVQNGSTFTYIDGFLPTGTSNDQATDINNAGVVSGFYTTATVTDGFLLNGTTLTTLSFPGSVFTQALGLNNAGDVVGDYVDSFGVMHGFVFDGVSFKTFDAPGSTATTINGINDNGQIVGFFTDANQNTIGFVGNPIATPEPRASTLLALAVVAMGLIRRSKLGHPE